MDFNDMVAKGEELPMRDIIHKTASVLQGRGKVITLKEHADEKECVTDVRKNFIYLASHAQSEEAATEPRVFIKKSFDSVSRDERFCFRVKGFFYVNQGRRLMKVDYCHTLRIQMHWKHKLSTPKKTVTMA